MASHSRTASYTIEDDRVLCRMYLDISQNPIIGKNQTSVQFWDRVSEAYNSSRSSSAQGRNGRSLQCRWNNINKAVGKLRGCVRQIENLHPSGASEEDIVSRI